MLVLSAEEIRACVSMPRLVEALRGIFGAPCVTPSRQLIPLPPGKGDRIVAIMPAFDPSGAGVVKVFTSFPESHSKGLPTIQAVLMVFSVTGTPVAVLDGTTVTRLRTGATSALASTYLSRADSSHLLIVGTGALAPYMALGHSSVRPITRISVWGRRQERIAATVGEIHELLERDIDIRPAQSLEQAVQNADIISCATSSPVPVLQGVWIRPGTFIDLVGSFSPTTREADDEAVRRSRLFVDTFEGSLTEAGDLLDPMRRGVIGRERIEGELADLVLGRAAGRGAADEITLFKSVGSAIEDLAAARLVVAQHDLGGH